MNSGLLLVFLTIYTRGYGLNLEFLKFNKNNWT